LNAKTEEFRQDRPKGSLLGSSQGHSGRVRSTQVYSGRVKAIQVRSTRVESRPFRSGLLGSSRGSAQLNAKTEELRHDRVGLGTQLLEIKAKMRPKMCIGLIRDFWPQGVPSRVFYAEMAVWRDTCPYGAGRTKFT